MKAFLEHIEACGGSIKIIQRRQNTLDVVSNVAFNTRYNVIKYPGTGK
jgi:hypothetical protein